MSSSHIIKYLSFGLKKKSGINNSGRKMFKTRGSGCPKRKFRLIDFYRVKYQIPAIVLKIEYDPNRTSFIALICYKNGILSYILATNGLLKGTFLNNSVQNVGIANKIKNFSLGTYISILELRPGFGAKISRSAGTYCVILKRDQKLTLVRLPSGVQRFFSNDNICTLGIVSNLNHKFKKKKKAGNNFWLGRKSVVRGVAKNSVDHPNGGGRGKTSPWSLSTNFTGRVRKGVKWTTRRSKRYKKQWLNIS